MASSGRRRLVTGFNAAIKLSRRHSALQADRPKWIELAGIAHKSSVCNGRFTANGTGSQARQILLQLVCGIRCRSLGDCYEDVLVHFGDLSTVTTWYLRQMPVSCHFRGCKAPLFRIVSGAISSALPFTFYFLPPVHTRRQISATFVVNTKSRRHYVGHYFAENIGRRSTNQCKQRSATPISLARAQSACFD